MLYTSTRSKDFSCASAEAIRRGLAPDGGLFLPSACPRLGAGDISRLCTMDYPARAAEILSLFLTDYSKERLSEFTHRAYGNRFPSPCAAPVVSVRDGVHILELFRGPTSAFKDMALQMLPLLLTEALRMDKIEEQILILTATSGDTGSAAMTGFADVAGTKICVFYPKGGTSVIQRLQMTTNPGKNVYACAVNGNFDDAQRGVKNIFSDKAYGEALLKKGIRLSSANSINWGRLAPQIAYYFSAYVELINSGTVRPGEEIVVVVPTGNFGNILAARYAKEMGLPVKKLVCASNQNDVLTDFIKTGIYDRRRPFYRTESPSMDILVSSNLERLLYLLSGCDSELIAKLMRQLNEDGVYTVPDGMKAALQAEFFACRTLSAEVASTIRESFERDGYVPDPHTAVALHAASQYRAETGDTSPILVAATASPFKFPKTVLEALGQTVPDDEFAMLDALASFTGYDIPANLAVLRGSAERFTGCVEKDAMKDAVSAFAGLV